MPTNESIAPAVTAVGAGKALALEEADADGHPARCSRASRGSGTRSRAPSCRRVRTGGRRRSSRASRRPASAAGAGRRRSRATIQPQVASARSVRSCVPVDVARGADDRRRREHEQRDLDRRVHQVSRRSLTRSGSSASDGLATSARSSSMSIPAAFTAFRRGVRSAADCRYGQQGRDAVGAERLDAPRGRRDPFRPPSPSSTSSWTRSVWSWSSLGATVAPAKSTRPTSSPTTATLERSIWRWAMFASCEQRRASASSGGAARRRARRPRRRRAAAPDRGGRERVAGERLAGRDDLARRDAAVAGEQRHERLVLGRLAAAQPAAAGRRPGTRASARASRRAACRRRRVRRP